METMDAMSTSQVALDREEPTRPPHQRSEQRLEELWQELETARNADWIRCLTMAVGCANERNGG